MMCRAAITLAERYIRWLSTTFWQAGNMNASTLLESDFVMNRALTALLLYAISIAALWAQTCPPQGYTRPQLLNLQQSGFMLPEQSQRDDLALALLACSGNADPLLRDRVMYEGLASWLRGQQLTPATVNEIYQELLRQVAGQDHPPGFQRPFAALVLSEVARTDRIQPAFTADRRQQLVEVAATYLESVTDYRGFSETEGWRHGVAHGADLILQLVLNPNIDGGQLVRLMDAVARQVVASDAHFYVHGEPGRLARPVFYAWRRDVLDVEQWDDWFNDISSPGPLDSWAQAFSSQAGLAKRHNTLAFLLSLHFNATSTSNQAESNQATAWLQRRTQRAISRVLGE